MAATSRYAGGLAGWNNRHQQDVIEYFQEENRILKAELEGTRTRFTDDEQRRLAVRGKILGRMALPDVASIVTPETILRWHRKLIAMKCDGRVIAIAQVGGLHHRYCRAI